MVCVHLHFIQACMSETALVDGCPVVDSCNDGTCSECHTRVIPVIRGIAPESDCLSAGLLYLITFSYKVHIIRNR